MRKPAQVTLGIAAVTVGLLALVMASCANAGGATPASAPATGTAITSATPAPPSSMPTAQAPVAQPEPAPAAVREPAALPVGAHRAPAARPALAPAPQPASQPVPERPRSTFYENCDAVRAAGAAPLHRDDPGYRPALDRDNDGIACEPEPAAKPEPRPRPAQPAPEPTVYENCDAVRAAGAAPLHRDEPGYRPALDRDNDGIACEPERPTKPEPSPTPEPTPEPEPAPQPEPEPEPEATFYENCDAAREAGAAPLHEGDPGYRPALDRDGDGIACEPK